MLFNSILLLVPFVQLSYNNYNNFKQEQNSRYSANCNNLDSWLNIII